MTTTNTTPPKATKGRTGPKEKLTPMAALREQVATLTTRFDHEVDRLAGLIADNKRAVIAAQTRADHAFNKATLAYDKLGQISDTLDLIPEQFRIAHERIEQLERRINDGIKPAIEAVGQKVDGAYKLAEETHHRSHGEANELATQASTHAHQAATSAALALLKANATADVVSSLQKAIAALEVRVFPTALSVLIKDDAVVSALDSGNERVVPFDPAGVIPKVPA